MFIKTRSYTKLTQENLYKGFVILCSVDIRNSTTGINHLKIITLNLKLVILLIRHYHPVKCIMVKTCACMEKRLIF